MRVFHERGDVREKGRPDLAGLIACLPEVALKGFQIGCLHITGDEVADVSLEGALVVAVLGREGIAVLGEAGTVPLVVEDPRERL